jgi:hypothetical protein
MLAGCAGEPWPRPRAVPLEQFAAEHQAWRDWRRSRLVASGSGPVIYVGLWELPQGATQVGSDTALPIVVPASDSPRLAGTLHRSGQDVRFEPASGVRIRLANGNPFNPAAPLKSDRADSATDLALGSLRFRVHGEPGTDRLWLRAWDEDHPARRTFQLPDQFPLDTAWRLAARFRPYGEPRTFRVQDILLGTQEYRAPGELVFRVAGREYRLVPFADSTAKDYFIMLRDSTAATATYQAGRYMRVPFPDSTGWTVIDFNRAYNPPCVFTYYSTCALPPQENRLSLAITAGEKRLH